MQLKIVNDGKSIEIVAKDGGCQMFYATKNYAQMTMPVDEFISLLAGVGLVSQPLKEHTHQAQGLFDLVAPTSVTLQTTQNS